MAKEPVCGRVLCGGRGVPGVVVTDGERFTQTDSHGAYRLVCGENAMHVYISVPAGYTVPVRGERSDVLDSGGHACRA